MHRVALRALAACVSLTAFSTSLSAAPLTLDPRLHALAPPAVQAEPAIASSAPAPVHQVQNMGGGFIEALFRGTIHPQPGVPHYAQPQYPPQPQYAPPQPQHAAAPQPQYTPQPQAAAPQPQYAPVAQPQPAPPMNPLEALFAPLQQRPQPQSEMQTASYEPDHEEQGYRDPYVRNPRRAPLSAVPHPGPHSVAPRDAAARYQINPKFLKQTVPYNGKEAAGTIIIDTPNKFLYLVQSGGTAVRYGVGVGRPGFTWAGTKTVSLKKEWPDWTPPPEMLQRQPDLPRHMAGGPKNPLGARALYLGSSLYRIHGSNEPWTIGTNVSSGCIRMRNEDVIDLYERVKVGTRVVVI
jgi:lipoprotein-anchoring transpeptidase ErfK/SrfK